MQCNCKPAGEMIIPDILNLLFKLESHEKVAREH